MIRCVAVAVLSCCKCDIAAGATQECIQQWRAVLLSTPTDFNVLNGEVNKLLYSVQFRQKKVQEEHRVVARTPAPWAVEVVMCHDRMPRGPGNRPLGAEQVASAFLDNVKFSRDQETRSKTFVDNCITFHERMLQDNDIAACIMEAANL